MKLRFPFLLTAVVVAASLAVLRGADRTGDDAAARHVLNRLGFGGTPEDVAGVRQMGVARYIDEQLHPERIDDRAVTDRLAGFATLHLDSRTLAQKYEQPLLDARRDEKQTAGNAGSGAPPAPGARPQMRMSAEREAANLPLAELSQQKVLRAVYSERQLQEVLTDFWFNHFNVDARKGPERFLLTEYERDVIRPHIFGRFRDLLGATAKSPAMLFYLDNWMSVDPNARTPRQLSQGQQPQRRGLNENYARELMELHTLGVDGGYTQQDVTDVARAFTGWSIDRPREGGDFRFQPRMHDPGEKIVLGHTIKAGGGESDGETVLDILAKAPSTPRFVATKLARRFISDTPPPAIVDRAASRFRETDGDLREVVRTILSSREFQSADSYAAKAKTPLEFLVSALRAAGTSVTDAR